MPACGMGALSNAPMMDRNIPNGKNEIHSAITRETSDCGSFDQPATGGGSNGGRGGRRGPAGGAARGAGGGRRRWGQLVARPDLPMEEKEGSSEQPEGFRQPNVHGISTLVYRANRNLPAGWRGFNLEASWAVFGGYYQWVLDAVCETVEWPHQPLGFDSLAHRALLDKWHQGS